MKTLGLSLVNLVIMMATAASALNPCDDLDVTTHLHLAELQDSYGDGWNDNIMTIEDCDGNSYTPFAGARERWEMSVLI